MQQKVASKLSCLNEWLVKQSDEQYQRLDLCEEFLGTALVITYAV